jgi:Zn-dependent protease/tetratricopeptide (TPR) repeat protein
VAKVRAGARPTASAAGPVTAPSVAPASAVDADIHAFEQQLAVLRATRWSRQKKLKVFLATAVLFLAVGSLWISWTFLPVLLAVIALHEGGHFLAMKLTGYSNLSVFFLPGLGGLASGEKASAGPWEKLFVSLAGPVPGILLALAGLMAQAAGVFEPAPWFQEFLLVCLFINYLNLLPITPLDGGRVVEALLFARMPVARFLFAAVGVAAFAAFGVGTGDNVILVVALLLAFALPHQWRVMRLDRAIPRLPGETVDERGAVERLFRAMQQPRFARWPFQTRAAAATTLLPELQGRRARAVECAGGIAIYAACLMAPLAAATIAVPHFLGFAALAYSGYGIVRDDVDAEPAGSPQAPARDWYAEAARVDSLPEAQRLEVLLGAAAHAQDIDEGEKAKELLEAAWRIAQQRPPQDPARARTLLALGRNSETPDQRQRWLRQLVDEMQSTGERGSLLLLAEAKERLAWEDGLPESGRTALLRDVVAHRELALPADSHELLGARRALAGALDKEGQPQQAEALLRQSIDSLALPLPADRSVKALQRRVLHLDAYVELAWFLTAHARPQEAAAVLEPALALVPARVSRSWDQPNRQAREAQLWAHLAYAEPQRVKESWQRYEESRKSIGGSAGPLLQHELDRLVVAGVAREEGWKQEAEGQIRKALKTRSGGFVRTRLCGQQEAPDSWRARQREARTAAARAAGVCAST